jgi:hypothetical protein
LAAPLAAKYICAGIDSAVVSKAPLISIVDDDAFAGEVRDVTSGRAALTEPLQLLGTCTTTSVAFHDESHGCIPLLLP